MTEIRELETKFNRCSRYIEKYLREAPTFLGDDILQKSADELEDVEEKIETLLRTVEPRITSLQENLSGYEAKVAELGNDATDEMSQKVDEMTETVFGSEDLMHKLRVRLERLQRFSTQMPVLQRFSSRHSLVSQGTGTVRSQLHRVDPAGFAADDTDRQSVRTALAPSSVAESREADLTADPNAGPNRDGIESTASRPASTSRQPIADAENVVRLLYERLTQDNSTSQRSTDADSHLKLPKYNLPVFKGEPEQWSEFWDKFDRAVDRRTTLADVEKLQYLQGCCKGDASKLVAGLPLSNDNYAVACSLLKDRFGNPNVAIDKIYAKLVEMNPVLPRNTEKLREFYFDLENSLRRLEALGADSKSNHMVGVVLKKLPRYLVAQLERGKGPRQQWSMQLLRELLSIELEIEEATYRRSENKKPENKAGPPNPKQSGSTTGSFKAQDGQNGNKRKENPACFYCKDQHWSNECTKYKTATERRAIVKESRCCFICLRSNHAAKDCKAEKPCFHCKKVKLHHSSLCPDKFGTSKQSDSTRNVDEDTEDLTDQQDVGGLASDEYAVMKTAMCEAINPETADAENVRVFFDSGTSRTWMTEKIAKKLKLKVGARKRLLVNRFADDGEPKSIEMREAALTLKNREGKKWKIVVAVTPKALGSITLADKSEIASKLPRDLVLADKLRARDSKVEIYVMIGNDYYDDLVYSERFRVSNGLHAINSAFGWIVSGRIQNSSRDTEYGDMGFFVREKILYGTEMSVEIQDNREVKQNLEDLWSLEAIAIRDEPNDITDDIAIENFNKTVKFSDSRYQVVWPWMNNADLLPKNDDLALRRLKGQVTRMQKQKNDNFLQEYDGIIKDQLSKQIIEEVPKELVETQNRVHYIPHHGVVKQDSLTTKLRIVYDASAKKSPDLPSLNDCLYRGQVFLENLVSLLIRFRMHRVAVVADIEKAFLQIGLQEAERDVTRFYWIRDVKMPVQDDNIVTYRFTRVSFGVKSSPFLLGATVIYHLKQDGSDAAKQIEKGLYVDNVITGTDTVNKALTFYRNAKKIFKNASMNIREFCSSHDEFDEQVDQRDSTKYKEFKVLGLARDRTEDVLAVKIRPVEKETVNKKAVLSVIHRVYDPLGLMCPVLLPSKIFLQVLNKKKIHWDEKLPKEFEDKWTKIQSEMATNDGIKVQRYIGFRLDQCDRLMCFCDASAEAYAAAIYLQRVNGDKRESHLVFAKARVSPITKMTIPRLELLAVLLGVRMIRFLRQELPYEGKAIVWSDSQCVLRWIPDHSVTGQFIQNRVREIRKSTNTEFRYVPTKENPADIASRGAKPHDLSELWWHGPEWSIKDNKNWPQWDGNVEKLKAELETETDEVVNQAVASAEQPPFGIEINRFSTVKRLARVTAYCQRYIDKLRKVNTAQKIDLDPQEIRNAMLKWIKYVQNLQFADLKSDIAKGKKNSIQLQLGVVEDQENILKCHGRLSQMSAVDDTINPILLPSKSKFTDLIIEECHKRSLHSGLAQTLATARLEFWIPRGRARVKSVIDRCVTCKYYSNKVFARPMMPELPASRTNVRRPFSHVGLDYFGPLYTKNRDKETNKRWVCLVTCFATRAIHLEMVKDLSAEEFLLALRRFMARRGKPESITSDNATQFKAVKKIDPISQALSGDGISWKFIPELTPWAGGVYERMVKSVKTAMKKSLRKVLLTDSQLATVLTEVENAVNSRPLTYVTDDINSWRVLTPNDFLGVETQTTIPRDQEEFKDSDYREKPEMIRETLARTYKAQMHRLEQVWNVWKNDYLLSLRESLKYRHNDPRSKVEREPLVGEVVIVKDENLNRGKWKIANIQSLNRSSDGKVRSVKLLMNGNTLTRPVNLLYPLETGIPSDDKAKTDQDDEDKQDVPKRPGRKAASIAKERIRKIIEDDDEEKYID